MGDRVTRRLHWEAAVETEVMATPTRSGRCCATSLASASGATSATRPGGSPATTAPGGRPVRGKTATGFRWCRHCTITEVEPERRLVYRTRGGLPPDSTEWSFELEPTSSGGTRIRQSFRLISMPLPTELMIRVIMPSHRDRRPALEGDLVRLGEVAAGRVAAG